MPQLWLSSGRGRLINAILQSKSVCDDNHLKPVHIVFDPVSCSALSYATHHLCAQVTGVSNGGSMRTRRFVRLPTGVCMYGHPISSMYPPYRKLPPIHDLLRIFRTGVAYRNTRGVRDFRCRQDLYVPPSLGCDPHATSPACVLRDLLCNVATLVSSTSVLQ